MSNEISINEKGELIGAWSDASALEYFSKAENANISKLVIKSGHDFKNFGWFSKLENIEELYFDHADYPEVILDLGLLPKNPNRETLKICFSIANFKSLLNWYNTDATHLEFFPLYLDENAKEHGFIDCPEEQWGEKIQKLWVQDGGSVWIDVKNFYPESLKDFHFEYFCHAYEWFDYLELDNLGGTSGFFYNFVKFYNEHPALRDANFKAKRILVHQDSFLSHHMGDIYRVAEVEFIENYNINLEGLLEISESPTKIKEVLERLPETPCTITVHNIEGVDLFKLKYLLEAFDKVGHRIISGGWDSLQFNPKEQSFASKMVENPLSLQATSFSEEGISQEDLKKGFSKHFPDSGNEGWLVGYQWTTFGGHDRCLFLAQDFQLPSGQIIDMIGLDKNGAIVVMDFQGGRNSGEIGKMLNYVGEISELGTEQFLSLFSEEKNTQIKEHIKENDLSLVNNTQRILLIAESFSNEALLGVQWFNRFQTKGEWDTAKPIACLATQLFKNTEGEFFLKFDIVKELEVEPAFEAKQEKINTIINTIENTAAQGFLRKHVEGEWRLKHPSLYIRSMYWRDYEREWILSPNKDYVRVLQSKDFTDKFDNSIHHWKATLSEPNAVHEVQAGLEFRLVTEDDFNIFNQTVKAPGHEIRTTLARLETEKEE